MLDDRNDPYAPPSARVEDASRDTQWHWGFRVFRALRWAFFVWLGATMAIGVVGGLIGRQFGDMHASFSDAAEIWALVAAFRISLLFAAIAFPIGLLRRIAASDLARLSSRRAPAGSVGVMQAQEVAARHLHTPVYVVDYARMKKTTLDEVHGEIRQGRLRTHWQDGICFVDAETSQTSSVSPD